MNRPQAVGATGDRRPALRERLDAIAETLRREYCRKHRYPWLIAYSGGKDSTLLLQMVWETVAALPTEERRRRIIVVGNDTLVESPLVIRHLRKSIANIGAAAAEQSMPVHTEMTTPAIDQTFWVNVIGRGYIPADAELPLVHRPDEDISHQPVAEKRRPPESGCHPPDRHSAQRVAEP